MPFRLHKRLNNNASGTDYFVGDIHGSYVDLMDLLEGLRFDRSKDRLITMGDLINKGPDSHKALSLLKKPWFHSTIGNHEHALLQVSAGRLNPDHLSQTMGWVNSLSPHELSRYAELITERMTLSITVLVDQLRVGVIHAYAPDDWKSISGKSNTISGTALSKYLWSFDQIESALSGKAILPTENVDIVILGHASTKKPLQSSNKVWIDTFRRGGRFSTISSKELQRV